MMWKNSVGWGGSALYLPQVETQDCQNRRKTLHCCQNILQTDEINPNLSITGGHQHVAKEVCELGVVVGASILTLSSCYGPPIA